MKTARHPSDAFRIERDALAAALASTAILIQRGNQCPPHELAASRAGLNFAHHTLVAKVAGLALPGREP